MRSMSRSAPKRGIPLPRFRGQASIELILVLPILLMLIFGGLDFARAVALHDALNSGVGIATRALSLDPSQWTWASATVRAEVANNVFGIAGIGPVTMIVSGEDGSTLSAGQLSSLGFGDTFCLQGGATFTPAVPFLSNTPVPISARHCGIVERMP
jgi:Flp pilus assembly protein TadG